MMMKNCPTPGASPEAEAPMSDNSDKLIRMAGQMADFFRSQPDRPPAEAVAAYRQALAKSDGETAARAQFLIGKIQADQEDVGEAVKSFIKAAYGYSAPKWQAKATFEAARCLESLGQKPQAAAMYQELLDKFPKSDKTDAAKKRLAELQGKK